MSLILMFREEWNSLVNYLSLNFRGQVWKNQRPSEVYWGKIEHFGRRKGRAERISEMGQNETVLNHRKDIYVSVFILVCVFILYDII